MKRVSQTRNKITWYCNISLTLLAIISMIVNMESVALACIGGIITVSTAYHGSQAWTKNTYLKTNLNKENNEG